MGVEGGKACEIPLNNSYQAGEKVSNKKNESNEEQKYPLAGEIA